MVWTWFSDRFFGVVPAEEVARSEASLAVYVKRESAAERAAAEAKTEMEARENPAEPAQCKGGCGFFASPNGNGFCSVCAKKR